MEKPLHSTEGGFTPSDVMGSVAHDLNKIQNDVTKKVTDIVGKVGNKTKHSSQRLVSYILHDDVVVLEFTLGGEL